MGRLYYIENPKLVEKFSPDRSYLSISLEPLSTFKNWVVNEARSYTKWFLFFVNGKC